MPAVTRNHWQQDHVNITVEYRAACPHGQPEIWWTDLLHWDRSHQSWAVDSTPQCDCPTRAGVPC